MMRLELTPQEKERGIDLRGYNHWSATAFVPLVPKILAAGKVYADDAASSGISATTVFHNTLRNAASLLGYFNSLDRAPAMANGLPAADFLEAGRVVLKQIPAELREEVDEELRKSHQIARSNFDPRGIGSSSQQAVERRAEACRNGILLFGGTDLAGAGFVRSTSVQAGKGVEVGQPVVAEAGCR